jgi:hypothetical protein
MPYDLATDQEYLLSRAISGLVADLDVRLPG